MRLFTWPHLHPAHSVPPADLCPGRAPLGEHPPGAGRRHPPQRGQHRLGVPGRRFPKLSFVSTSAQASLAPNAARRSCASSLGSAAPISAPPARSYKIPPLPGGAMDLPILIILAVVCIFIGFFLDNLLHSLRGEKAADAPTQRGEAASKQEEVSGAAAGSEEMLSTSSGPVLEEVFRIWRGPVGKDLVVEVNGKKAHTPSDLDRDQLDRLGAALQELSAWLGRGVSAQTSAPPSSHPAGWPETSPGLVESLSEEDSSAGEVRRPSLNPFDVVSNALRAEIRKPPGPAEKSLAAQVDAVLQEQLKGTPLEKRGIRLTDAPDGGLLVHVGMEKYRGVEEVPDMEIREMIHSAVSEWGKRISPGGPSRSL